MAKAQLTYRQHHQEPELKDETLKDAGFKLNEPVFEWLDAQTETVTYFQGDDKKEYDAILDKYSGGVKKATHFEAQEVTEDGHTETEIEAV